MMVDTLCAIKKAMENVSVENDECNEGKEEREGRGGHRGFNCCCYIANEWTRFEKLFERERNIERERKKERERERERLLTMSFFVHDVHRGYYLAKKIKSH
jgi:hypothetical protein